MRLKWTSKALSDLVSLYALLAPINKPAAARTVRSLTTARNGRVYLSRFADGRRAPIHVLDGLPGELVTTRDGAGRVAGTVDSIVAGFVRRGQFMTRDEAARGIDGQPVSRRAEQADVVPGDGDDEWRHLHLLEDKDETAALDAWTLECGNGVLFVA